MEKWTVIFVSLEERYGLAVKVNGVLQLTCRGMVRPLATRICEALNNRATEIKTDDVYNAGD
jgi:hypothetical protein